jgi:hypothetical protein
MGGMPPAGENVSRWKNNMVLMRFMLSYIRLILLLASQLLIFVLPQFLWIARYMSHGRMAVLSNSSSVIFAVHGTCLAIDFILPCSFFASVTFWAPFLVILPFFLLRALNFLT